MIRASQLHYEISHAYICKPTLFFCKNHFRFGYPFRNIQVERKNFWWIDLHFNTHSCLYKWRIFFPTDFDTLPEYISESKNIFALPVPFFHPHGIIRVKWKIFSNFGCVFLSSPDYISEKKKRPLVSRRCGNNQWFLKNVFNPCLLTFLSAFCFLNYAASSLKNLPWCL